MITLNKTIRLFLDSIGRRDEYEFYLDKFKSSDSACFALLCPDIGSIEAGAEILAFDLHFLLRLELVPTILLTGPEANNMQTILAQYPVFIFQNLKPDTDVTFFIQRARNAQQIPVLMASELDLETALLQLIPSIANRVHCIHADGGIRTVSGELLPYIYTHKENPAPLENPQADILKLGKILLDQRPGIHLSLTSPINLLQEIFTVKGAGTLFRKGSEILHFNRIKQVDQERLQDLLETSFSKKLASDAFFDRIAHIYLEKEYRGAMLLEDHPQGLYLSKFAVGRTARGEGLALELWHDACRNHPALFWRSNVTNPFNSWYHRQADGHHNAGKWQIFWRGIPTEAISNVITHCCTQPEDFQSGHSK